MGPANHRPAPRGQSYHRSRSSLKRPCQIRSGWRAEQSARGCRSWLEKRPGLVLVDRTMKGVVDARGRRVRALVRSDRGRLGHCRRRSRDGRESAPSCHAHRRSGGSSRVIADSEIWVAIHLVIVFGITLMLGGLVAIYHSIRGGIAGALARFGLFAAVVGATVGLVLVIPSRLDRWPRSGQPHPLTKRPRHSASSTPTRPSTSRWPASSISSSPR